MGTHKGTPDKPKQNSKYAEVYDYVEPKLNKIEVGWRQIKIVPVITISNTNIFVLPGKVYNYLHPPSD